MKTRKWQLRSVGAVLIVCSGLAGLSALVNSRRPVGSAVVEQLSEAEKGRLAEFWQLRSEVGADVWPGWQKDVSPTILYNERYAFLVGYPDPPAGWFKINDDVLRGGAWTPVPNDLFEGEPYYRQRLPASGDIPEAFTVLVGDRWVSSMPTQEWMAIGLADQFRGNLPGFLIPIFPYEIVTGFFLRGSDGYISLLAHESFHASQGQQAPGRLRAAERAVTQAEPTYPWDDSDSKKLWATELALLTRALKSKSDADSAELARQFLAARDARRPELTAEQISYEQQREWLEGVARYVELEVWRQAAASTTYQPHSAMADDPDFNNYATFDRRWRQEINQIQRMAGAGDTVFYYSGMAQAVLLDRLAPGWKTTVLQDEVYLEDLLRAVVEIDKSHWQIAESGD